MPPKQSHVASTAAATNKRKHEPEAANGAARKRNKTFAIRKLTVQSHDEAFSNGGLNVADFVRAREFEIQALEHGIRSSSHALSSRAFQEVPRELRRRTASHNVKCVPKRLQSRARREMQDDKTVAKRKKKILPQQRMRLETIKRMRAVTERLKERKAAKKARRKHGVTDEGIEVTNDVRDDVSMGENDPPAVLQRHKSKMKNAQLSQPPVPAARFRKRQIEKTWLPTHMYHAKRAHMSAPLDPLWRFALPITPTEKSYRKTHRATTLRGAMTWDTSYVSTICLRGRQDSIIGMLKAIGIGCDPNDPHIWGLKGSRWRKGLRSWSGNVHKRQRYPSDMICPAVILWDPEHQNDDSALSQDGRPNTISARNVIIQCHPSAFLELWRELCQLSKVQKPSVKVEDLRYDIGSIHLTGPQASEALASIMVPTALKQKHENSHDALRTVWKALPAIANISLLPRDIVISTVVCDPRLMLCKTKSAQSVDHAATAQLVTEISLNWPLDKEVQPILLLDKAARAQAYRSLPTQKSIGRRRAAVLPGQAITPKPDDPSIPVVIYSSSSGNANQGSWTILLPWKCLLAVWYPLMYLPLSTGGTVRFGGLEELRQIAFEAQRPWFPADYPGTKAGQAWELSTQEAAKKAWLRKPKGRRTEFESVDLGGGRKGEIGRGWACDWEALAGDAWPLCHVPMPLAQQHLLRRSDSGDCAVQGLTTVKVTMITRGVPQTRARVYRLPTNSAQLRQRWLAFASPAAAKRSGAALPQVGAEAYPIVPDRVDLIGFLTTGNFNLSAGLGTGIGSIMLSKVDMAQDQVGADRKARAEVQFCIVRNAGESFGRLARWDLVA